MCKFLCADNAYNTLKLKKIPIYIVCYENIIYLCSVIERGKGDERSPSFVDIGPRNKGY